MNILFTCGGTAGHINPAIALARLFQLHHPGCNILFAGAYNGMERDLVPKEGYQLRTVYVNTIHRAFRWIGAGQKVPLSQRCYYKHRGYRRTYLVPACGADRPA